MAACTPIYVVRDIEDQGVNYFAWGYSLEDAKATVAEVEAALGTDMVELVTFATWASLDAHTRDLIGGNQL